MKYLNKINSPKDLRKMKLKSEEKKVLAEEIRQTLIEKVSKTGGHLASSLGCVELTIALHETFNTPKDKIIWDVGHQTYAHKLLTGRKNKFDSLRKLGGISGFPKIEESEYDVFDTGHSSTSISAALGIARARDLAGDDYKVIAVIGDGALTGGMALEAMADAGVSKKNLIVVLNDNQMSIEKNTGGLSKMLTNMRTRKSYSDSNRFIKKLVLKIPKFGKWVIKRVRRFKLRIKLLLSPNMLFEQMGFKYLGPVDGNDIDKLEALLSRAKDFSGPILIHAKTVKGKGYKFAEENPDKFHSVSPFDIETGKSLKEKSDDYSKVFGEHLVKLAKTNKKIVAVTAAMASGTGLDVFKEIYPDRFFDVEIAEQHSITMCAGMARTGMIPVVSIYSSFMQRAFDQIIHDVCMQNLHVVMCLDRAGLVGADGETHQGIFDLAYLRLIPNLTIMAPKNFKELKLMLEFAINEVKGPVAIRYPRGGESNIDLYQLVDDNKELLLRNNNSKIELGVSEKLSTGDKVQIIAIGKMVDKAIEVAHELKIKNNIKAEVINARFLKPFDESVITKSKAKHIYTIEDGTIKGGLYSEVSEIVLRNKLKKFVHGFGYNDLFIKQGKVEELEKLNGMDSKSIYEAIIKDLDLKPNKKNNKKDSKKKEKNNKIIKFNIG